ncbi:MAG: flippase-like domain-containing protein [Candidatus Krumholzibacteria bacterium]|nr:flippase-like domain-containing protein [Candidatus Krumholzibacteria bacterium]
MDKKRAGLQLLKITVSVGLIAILLYRISPGRLLEYLGNIDPVWMAVAVAIFLVSSLLGALQWHLLLSAGGVKMPVRRTFSLYFTGLFFNNLLPSNVGGDAYKIYDVVRTGYDPHKVFAITLLDRVIGITGLCLLALAASLTLFFTGGTADMGLYALVFAGCVVPILALTLSRKISTPLRRTLSRIRLWGIGERLELVFSHLGSFRSFPKLLGKVIALTLTIQILRISTHLAVAIALGIRPEVRDMLHFFVFVPLLGLIMMLPISINGLGLREGAGILLFTRIGLLEEEAFLMEFLTYVVMVGVSLIGGVLFLKRQITGSISIDKDTDSGV